MASLTGDGSGQATSSQAKLPSSSHRLPTVSASDALRDLGSNGPIAIPSGLPSLDAFLNGSTSEASEGFPRGKVSELWGPNGAGKTGLMLQAAVHCMLAGNHVVWLGELPYELNFVIMPSAYTLSDSGTPLSGVRLQSAIQVSKSGTSRDLPGVLGRFHHMSLPSLTHLLAMVVHPRPHFPPEKTSLVVIDEIHTLIDIDYPRFLQFTTSSRSEAQKWQANRRYAVLGSLANGLNKFAALNNVAIITSSGCSTRGRNSSGLRLALVPSVGGIEWDAAIYNKVVIFRDFDARFIGVQKARGRSFISREEVGESGRIIPFEVTQAGLLAETTLDTGDSKSSVEQHKSPTIIPSPQKGTKRVYDEIADSEGEDVDEYGWPEADEDVFVTENLVGGTDPALLAKTDTVINL